MWTFISFCCRLCNLQQRPHTHTQQYFEGKCRWWWEWAGSKDVLIRIIIRGHSLSLLQLLEICLFWQSRGSKDDWLLEAADLEKSFTQNYFTDNFCIEMCVWHDYRILFWSQMFLLLMVAVCESLNLNDQSKTESISWRQSEMRRQMWSSDLSECFEHWLSLTICNYQLSQLRQKQHIFLIFQIKFSPHSAPVWLPLSLAWLIIEENW